MRSVKFVAILVGVVVVFFLILMIWSLGLWRSHWVAGAVVCGVGFYYLVAYILERFVQQKVRPLYRVLGRKESEKVKSMVTLEGDIRAWAERSREQVESLKSMERYRREFLGNVSHELKTPLFSLQGYVDMLAGGIEDKALQSKYLERCDKNIDRLINIVKDLEDISQLEEQNRVLYRTDFDIAQLFRDVADGIANLAEAKGVKVSVLARGAVLVNGEREQIVRVAVNLLSNAVKYNVEGGRVEVRFEDMIDKIMIQVADTGVGIEKEHLGRVFERFYRTDKARSRQEGGTGLGLAIVKHIVEAHGEQINVISELNKETVFFFALKKPD